MDNFLYYYDDMHCVYVHIIHLNCSYEASAQDIEEGVLRMHRRITSENVKGYSSHIPGQEVDLDKEEDIVFKKGVLTHASGTTSCKLLTQVH